VKARAALFALLASAWGCATLPTCPAKGGTPWLELETSHFVLRTNMSGGDAEALLRTLEETRAALLAAVWPKAPDPPLRTRVVAVDSVKESFAYFPEHVWGLWYDRPPFPRTVLLGPRWQRDGFDVFAHELAHELSYHSLPLQPPWYSEGVATFVETLSYDRGTGTVTVGKASMQRLGEAKRSILPASRLIPAKGVPDGEDGGYFESHSWLLFHYLVDHDGAGLGRFQDLVRALVPAEQAWRIAFPTLSYEQVDQVLDAYMTALTFTWFRRPVVVPPYTVTRRVLPDATVHAQRALLLLGATDERSRRDVQTELDEAFSEERDALEALAMSYLRSEDAAERQRLARRAIQAHPNDELAAVMFADTLDAKDPAARAALVHALASAPRSRELVLRLARNEAARGDWPAAQRFAEQALRLGGARSSGRLLDLYAEALARTGRCSESAFVMDRIQAHLTGVAGAKADARGFELAALCRPAP
jgi:hypothetical protein